MQLSIQKEIIKFNSILLVNISLSIKIITGKMRMLRQLSVPHLLNSSLHNGQLGWPSVMGKLLKYKFSTSHNLDLRTGLCCNILLKMVTEKFWLSPDATFFGILFQKYIQIIQTQDLNHFYVAVMLLWVKYVSNIHIIQMLRWIKCISMN